MVMLAAALALAAQAAPEQMTRLNCRAVAINGATIDFPFELQGTGDTAKARVPIGNAPFVDPLDRHFFPIRNLPNTLIFDVMPMTANPGYFEVTLHVEQGGDQGLPVAMGYCQAGPIAASREPRVTFAQLDDALVVTAAAAHGPCYLLTLTGQVSRFRTRIEGQTRIFEPADAVIWPGRRVSVLGPSPPPHQRGGMPVYVEFFDGQTPTDTESPGGLAYHQVDQARALAVSTTFFIAPDQPPERHNALSICAIQLRRPA